MKSKEQKYCEFYNQYIVMMTEYVDIADKKLPINKKCSKWDECENREYCKYGKK